MSGDEHMHDQGPGDRTAGAASLDDLVGAYLLDALDASDQAAFEAFLLESSDARDEVALLRPIVQVLPLALVGSDDEAPAPSFGLRARILRAVREDETNAGGASVPESAAVAPAPPPIQRLDVTPPVGRTGGILAFSRRIGFDRIAAGFLALVAAGAIIWGVTLQSRLSDTENDLDAVRDELALEQGDGSGVVQAVVYSLNPTADGPAGANAIVSLQTEESGEATISANGLPATEEGRAYQLWYLDLDEAGGVVGAPRPSVTFKVGPDGAVVVDNVTVDAPFDAVAITNEPEAGSAAPTTAILMLGTRGTAAG